MSHIFNEKLVQLGIAAHPSRRQAIQWVMAAVAASTLPADKGLALPVGRTPTPQEEASPQTAPLVDSGYGTDPALTRIHKPGDLWPLTFTAGQLAVVTALADVILPEDALGPAASTVGVPAMINEWISAPYARQKSDRSNILAGLKFMDDESTKRFAKLFPALAMDQKQAICDDVCYAPAAKSEFHKTAQFFSRFRSLCASAYYATPQGWKAIGYVGNTPLEKFEGPPPEVLERLGLR